MIGTLEFILLVMWVPIAASWLAAPLLELGLRSHPAQDRPAWAGLEPSALPAVPAGLPFAPTIVVYERVCAADKALGRYLAALEAVSVDPNPPGRLEASVVADRRNLFESEALSLLSIWREWLEAVESHPHHNPLVGPIIESTDGHARQLLLGLLLPHERLAVRYDWHYGVGQLKVLRDHLTRIALGLRAYREAFTTTPAHPYR